MIALIASPRRPMRLADACYQALRLTGWLAVTFACFAALWLLFFAALTFAAFRFNWRGFVALAAFTLLCYAMVIWAAWQIDPRNMNLRAEILYWFFMAMLMPWLGAMASYLGQQRQRYQAGAALYRTVWNTAVDAVLVFDDKYDVRMANPAAARLFGQSDSSSHAGQKLQDC